VRLSLPKSPSETENRPFLRRVTCETVMVGGDVQSDAGSIAKKGPGSEGREHSQGRTRFTKVVRFGDSGCAGVLVMQSADLGDRNNATPGRRLDFAAQR
jgi:hypothetical protein